jgi:starch phosphorylase
MTDVDHTPSDGISATSAAPADLVEHSRTGMGAPALQRAITDHIRYSIGRPAATLRPEHYYRALSLAVRDRMQDRRVASTQTSLDLGRKVTCYLSAEFLMGPQLGNNLLNLQLEQSARTALAAMGQDLDEVLACEEEPGLGNGGLGRLAACYLDSLATLERPAIGYGIRYEFGIFDQEIHDGWQVEQTDNWLDSGNPWEIAKPDVNYLVKWGGYAEHYTDPDSGAGHDRVRWVPGRLLKGVAYDTPIQGYGVNTCNVLTLWSARAVKSFALEAFNTGDYYKAVEDEVTSETVTKVLYPNDEPEAGKRLRLLQQYFFVSCSLQHVLHIMDDLADAGVSRNSPSGSPCSSTTHIRRSRSPSSCGCWSTSASWTGTRPGTSRSRRSAIPTTPCCPRRWRPGRWRCSPSRCPATARSSMRSTAGSSTRCAPGSQATRTASAGCR